MLKTISTPLLVTLVLLSITLALNNCQSPSETTTATTSDAIPDSVYLAYGQQIAGTTFRHLSGRLQAALQEGGVGQAVLGSEKTGRGQNFVGGLAVTFSSGGSPETTRRARV